MKTLRDFKCRTCGEVTERFIQNNIEQTTCPCGGLADRMIGMPTVALDGTNPDFPGAYDKWARIREDNAKIKNRRSYAEG